MSASVSTDAGGGTTTEDNPSSSITPSSTSSTVSSSDPIIPSSSSPPPSSSSLSSSSLSHVVLSANPLRWIRSSGTDYVSKPRAFFDPLHHALLLVTGAPIPNKIWMGKLNKSLNNNNNVGGGNGGVDEWISFPMKLPSSADLLGACLSFDRSLLALRISDKEVRVLSTSNGEAVSARTCKGNNVRMLSVHWLKDDNRLLFVISSGLELYSVKDNKLRLLKSASFSIVYHWILIEENLLLLVNAKNCFQSYKLTAKSFAELVEFELDCVGTCLNTPDGAIFARDQLTLTMIYGRMVVVFVNEVKGQLHLLALNQNNNEMEQTHVFDLYQAGKYEISVIDEILLIHNCAAKVSMMFDVRSDSKSTITPPLAIGVPHLLPSPSSPSSPSPTYSYRSFSYSRCTFLYPHCLWESTGEQYQGNLWSLCIDYQQIVNSWPTNKRAKLIDFLMKRKNIQAKYLVLQIIQNIIVTNGPLSLVSRIFSIINRVLYDARSTSTPSMLKLNPPTAPPSAPSSQPPSTFSSPIITAPPIINQKHIASNSSLAATALFGGSASSINSSPPPPSTPSASSSSSFPQISIIPPSPYQNSRSVYLSSAPSSVSSYESDGRLHCELVDLQYFASQALQMEHNVYGYLIIHQQDMFIHVFHKAVDQAQTNPSLYSSIIIPALVEYIRSLYRHFLKPEEYLNDLLVWLLLKEKRYYDLHQYLQYHILNDSLPIANRLLALSSEYPAAYQLGLDMLFRLATTNGGNTSNARASALTALSNCQPTINSTPAASPAVSRAALSSPTPTLLSPATIAAAVGSSPAPELPSYSLSWLATVRLFKALLERKQIIDALKLATIRSPIFEHNGLTPRDFLQAAFDTSDRYVFYTSYKFFEQRFTALRGSPHFLVTDNCDEFIRHFGVISSVASSTKSNRIGSAALSNDDSTPFYYEWDEGEDEDLSDHEDDDESDIALGFTPQPSTIAPSTPTSSSITASASIHSDQSLDDAELSAVNVGVGVGVGNQNRSLVNSDESNSTDGIVDGATSEEIEKKERQRRESVVAAFEEVRASIDVSQFSNLAQESVNSSDTPVDSGKKTESSNNKLMMTEDDDDLGGVVAEEQAGGE